MKTQPTNGAAARWSEIKAKMSMAERVTKTIEDARAHAERLKASTGHSISQPIWREIEAHARPYKMVVLAVLRDDVEDAYRWAERFVRP